ncbi:MAG: H+transporting two-sector ATPase subunit [Rickettsiaceae bacterium]|jgi:F-type H+-transporting ATPase subunit b|nr:H+transporting two-sector ATPase subunit [Rickettsiaceae bacterium]
MPQLDFATYASQIFWLAVTFGLLYIIMAMTALPRVREVLQNRQTRISDDLIKAEKLKVEAEEAEADFTSVIATARAKASALLGDVREKAAAEVQVRNEKLDETFSRQAKEADHRIAIIKKEVASEMAPVVVDAAKDMIKKLININVDTKIIENKVSGFSNKE